MLKQTWILLIQRLLSPGKKTNDTKLSKECWHFTNTYPVFIYLFVPLQLFLFELQLQHDSAELHVKVVSPLQFPLIVLANVQSMPEKKKKKAADVIVHLHERP